MLLLKKTIALQPLKVNILTCRQKIENAGVNICYNVDPKSSILVTPLRILSDPLTYRKHIDVASESMMSDKLGKLKETNEWDIATLRFH